MLPFYKHTGLEINSTDLEKIKDEVRGLWSRKLFIIREVSPAAMYGVALYSCGNHILNNYPSYKRKEICVDNAGWTEASTYCPTLVYWLKNSGYSWNRIILWNCQKSYEQQWHIDDVDVIVHLPIIKPYESNISGCAWKNSQGDTVYDTFSEGKFYLFNPRIIHIAHNSGELDRYNLTGFISDDMKNIFHL